MTRYWLLLLSVMTMALAPPVEAQRASYPAQCTLTYIKAATTPDSTRARCLADRARVDLYNATTAYRKTDSLNRIALAKYSDAAVKDTAARRVYDSVMVQYKPKPPVPVATSIEIHSDGTTLKVGSTLQLYATVKDQNGATMSVPVAWSGAPSSVADISGTGLVTGKSAGAYTATAKAGTPTTARAYAVTGTPPVPPDTTKPPVPPVDTSTPPPVVTGPLPAPHPSGLGGGAATPAELPRASVNTTYPTGLRQVQIAAGANLQAALNAAQPGDELRLAPGASWSGNYLLPKHACTNGAPVVLRTDGPIPAPGSRVSKDSALKYNFAKVLALNNQGAFGTVYNSGVRCWRITGIEVAEAPGAFDANGLIRFGDETQSAANVAADLILDRVYVHGAPTVKVRRCVILNSARSAVVDSDLHNCDGNNGDTQCILSYNGPGPFLIDNVLCNGGTEVIMFGGADPSIQGMIAADVWIRNSILERDVVPKGTNLVKNLLESKNVTRLLVENVIMRNNWAHGQAGFGGLHKSTNQGSTATSCPWCRTTDVTWRYVRLVNSGNGINMAGITQGPATAAARYTFYHVTVDSLNYGQFLGDGQLAQMLGGSLSDVILSHVTLRNGGPGNYWGMISLDAGTIPRVSIDNSALYCGGYGIKGANQSVGMNSINAYLPNIRWVNNGLWGCTSGYPAGTTYVPNAGAATALPGPDGQAVGSAR
jgi:hypothetical protein